MRIHNKYEQNLTTLSDTRKISAQTGHNNAKFRTIHRGVLAQNVKLYMQHCFHCNRKSQWSLKPPITKNKVE